jgi:ornithine cyclodeaminase/alanine dehydrogenase-like protein (mu-crystallin family)
VEILASASARDAVRGADVVLCATNSFGPVYLAEWIEAGVHISTVQYQELETAVFKRADLLVAHYTGGRTPVIDSSRGIAHADSMEEGRRQVREAVRNDELPNLHDLVLGRAKGRASDEQVTCFLNYVGLGYQFAALGSLLFRKAREAGAGRELPTEWFTEDVNP